MLNTNKKTTQGLTSKRNRMTLNAKVNSDKERIRMFYLAYQIHTSNCSGLSTILKDISRFSRKNQTNWMRLRPLNGDLNTTVKYAPHSAFDSAFDLFSFHRFGNQTKNFRLYYDGMHYVGKLCTITRSRNSGWMGYLSGDDNVVRLISTRVN